MIKLTVGQRKESILLPIWPSSGRIELIKLQHNTARGETELVICGFSLMSLKHKYNEVLIMHAGIAFQ